MMDHYTFINHNEVYFIGNNMQHVVNIDQVKNLINNQVNNCLLGDNLHCVVGKSNLSSL